MTTDVAVDNVRRFFMYARGEIHGRYQELVDTINNLQSLAYFATVFSQEETGWMLDAVEYLEEILDGVDSYD